MSREPLFKYRALATDYDGTIASDGIVDDATVSALAAAREAGLRLILVTGRELSDLFATFPRYSTFDFIVAENGAVVHDTAAGMTETVAPAAPRRLLEALTARRIPFSTGRSIVATSDQYEQSVRDSVRDAGCGWHVILNKGSVMILPRGVTKASGLAAALRRLQISGEETIAVGDAENDEDLLRGCGLGVAVANALPSLKGMAGVVTTQSCGAGVGEVIAMFREGRLEQQGRLVSRPA